METIAHLLAWREFPGHNAEREARWSPEVSRTGLELGVPAGHGGQRSKSTERRELPGQRALKIFSWNSDYFYLEDKGLCYVKNSP